jgi:lipid A oxidase
MAVLRTTRRGPSLAWWGALGAAVLCALWVGLDPRPAAAEFQIGVYGGVSESFDSDVTLVQPGGTNLTLSDVPWDGKSFSDPPYWGIRGIWWFDAHPAWGLMVDYNHAKIYSELGSSVKVSGTRDGNPMSGTDKVGNTFDILEFTDGLNEIFFGGMYRWQRPRWTPYVGFGVGFAFPHVEVRRTGGTVKTYEYQVTGVAVEGLVGLEYRLTPRFSLFGDYKLSFSSNDADLNGGGTLETDVWTNQFIFGVSYRFGGGGQDVAGVYK